MKKNYMFQFANAEGFEPIKEDTGLITRVEAEALWDKYYPDFIKYFEEGLKPQMCMWIDCENTTDYHTELKLLDYRDDLIIENGTVFIRTKKAIK